MTEYEFNKFDQGFPPDPKQRRIFRDTEGELDLVQISLGTLLITVLLFFITIFYLSFYEDNPPMTVNNVEITTDTAPQGGMVSFIFDFCKHTTSPVDLRRAWENGTIRTIVSPDPPFRLPGCYKSPVDVAVPLDLLPGEEYYIQASFTFPVNHFAQRTVEERIGPFTITEAING